MPKFIVPNVNSNEEIEENSYVQRMRRELKDGSISPRTHTSRKIYPDNSRYLDEYQYEDSKVLRFGIDSKAIGVENGKILGTELPLYYDTDKGDSSSKSGKYDRSDALKIIHHPLEKLLLEKALWHLLSEENTKTTLVHIFARKNNKSKNMGIKILDDNHPETHTVLLYKNSINSAGKYEVLVIDPNNATFSSHLSGSDIDIVHDKLARIVTCHAGLKIYNSSPNFRDCLDIAVKLAFGFNKQSMLGKHYVFDTSSDKELSVSISDNIIVQSISNDTKVDKEMYVGYSGLPMKIKQTSDPELVLEFRRLMPLTIKRLECGYENITNEFIIKYKQIIKSYDDRSTDGKFTLKAICGLINSSGEQIQSEIVKEKVGMNLLIDKFSSISEDDSAVNSPFSVSELSGNIIENPDL